MTTSTMTFDIDIMTDLCHNALVAEINEVSRLPVSKRLELGRRRRRTQLDRYADYERQFDGSSETARVGKGKGKRQSTTCGKGEETGRPQSSLRRRKRPESVRFAGNAALLDAVTRNDLDEVRSLLLSEHCDVNSSVVNGLTSLHQACIDGHLPLVKLLTAQSAIDVNVRDADQWTPLHTAALCGHAGIARALTDRNADLLALNCDGFMPYDLCEDESTLDIIESAMARQGITQEMINDVRFAPEKTMLHDLHRLSRDRIGLDLKGENGETPLHIAAANGYIEVAEYLLSRQVSISAADKDLWQPIHCAAYWRQVPMLELLIKHGGDLDALTDDNKKPMDLCPDETVCKWLEELEESLRAHTATKSSAASPSSPVATSTAAVGSLTHEEISEILSPSSAALLRSSSTRIDGSHNSLYSSNVTLADKTIMSSSIRRLAAGHDKESEMMKRDARNEADIWTSMQSIHEADNDDETTEKQDGGVIIEPPKQFKAKSSANTKTIYENVDVIHASNQMDVVQQRRATPNDRGFTPTATQLQQPATQLQQQGNKSSSSAPNDPKKLESKVRNGEERPQSSTRYVIVNQLLTSGSSVRKSSLSENGTTRSRTTDPSPEVTSRNGKNADAGVRATSAASTDEPQLRGMTSSVVKKRRSEQRQRERQSASNSEQFDVGLTASTSSYNEKMYENIMEDKQRRCCAIS